MYPITYSQPTNTYDHVILGHLTQMKFLAYISAHLSRIKSDTIYFDTDTKEVIVDTGCSHTLTYDRNDFISYDITSDEVEGLGTHEIVGTGTVK